MEAPPFNSGLYTDFYELTMAQGYYLLGMHNAPAVFDLYFRTCPFGGAYAVAAGIFEAIDAILNLRFSDDECNYLSGLGFSSEFLEYLKHFFFSGDIDGCREGEIVFPGIPLLRICAPLIEAQILESMLLNIVNFQTLIATKAMRIVHAAQGRPIVDFGLRRAQGEASIAAARAAFIGGAVGTSNTLAAFKYGIPAIGTHAHSWVQSFDSEYQAFSAFARLYPHAAILLIDTYDTLESGLPNAIRVAREIESSGMTLRGVRIDSGDLLSLSLKVRRELDNAGLQYVKIVASDQLDEHRINYLLSQNAPIDMFGVGTKLICAFDQPALDGVYKLSEYDGRPRLKCSNDPSKINNPGKKRVIRYCCKDTGRFFMDVILLDDEEGHRITQAHDPTCPDTPVKLQEYLPESNSIMIPLVRGGRLVYSYPTLQEIQQYAQQRFSLLPDQHKRLIDPEPYHVGLSDQLYKLKQSLIQRRE